MAKGKSLLTESEVRKFMKFANIPHLAENFFKEGSYVEEGGMEETMHGATDEMVYEEDEEGEGEAEAPAAEAPAADVEDMATRLVKAIAAAISAETGIPVGVEGDGAAPEAPADDMEVEMPEEEGAEEAPADVEALAEAVLHRVMARVKGLNEAKERKAKLAKRVDEVTDRIMRRITR